MSKFAMCDRCRKLYSNITEDKPDPKYTLYRWYASPKDQKGASKGCRCLDLCDSCLAELEIFMEKGKAKVEEGHSTKEPEKTGTEYSAKEPEKSGTDALMDKMCEAFNRVWRQR